MKPNEIALYPSSGGFYRRLLQGVYSCEHFEAYKCFILTPRELLLPLLNKPPYKGFINSFIRRSRVGPHATFTSMTVNHIRDVAGTNFVRSKLCSIALHAYEELRTEGQVRMLDEWNYLQEARRRSTLRLERWKEKLQVKIIQAMMRNGPYRDIQRKLNIIEAVLSERSDTTYSRLELRMQTHGY